MLRMGVIRNVQQARVVRLRREISTSVLFEHVAKGYNMAM